MSMFKAVRIDKTESGTQAAIADFDEADLMDGDVTVRVTHSTVNYKDGLAITGKSPVVRRFPMIAGLVLAALTNLIYPVLYSGILASEFWPTTVLSLRNALEIALLTWANLRLMKITSQQLR